MHQVIPHVCTLVPFKGIPYAGSVTGAARFKEAPPPRPWNGVRDALGDGPGVAEVSRNMSTLWTSFAHHGHPGGHGLPAWPRYDLKRRATMLINVECQVVDDPDRPIRELWESLHL